MTAGAKERLVLTEVFPELDDIAEPRLRGSVGAVWERFWVMSAYDRLADVPVALKWEYPCLKHARAIVQMAVAAARVFEEAHGTTLDRDTLLAGAMLMEVSNLVEFRPKAGGGTEFTEIGSAGTHGWYAANVALELGVPFPVVHIVLSHSPNSGKPPATAEAQLLHWICQASVSAFRRDAWTRKVMHHQ